MIRRPVKFAAVFLVCLLAYGWAPRAQARPVSWSRAVASVYDNSGQTASGRHHRYSVAHRTLAFGTRVRLCYRRRCVTAVVDDRGPFVGGRDFDLATATYQAIGFPYGVAVVRWRIA